MNLQISTDIKNKKLKINTSEEGTKIIHLDEIKNISSFENLDNYIYLGNIKKSSIDSGYIGKIIAIRIKQTNQIYFLKAEFFDNGIAYDDNSYKSLLKWLILITDKSLPHSIELIKLTREGIQRVSKELSVKDIPLYPSRIDWIWELNLNMQLLLVKYNLYPKISDTLVGLIENLDNKLQVSLLINSGIVKWEIVERYFKIRINEDKVCFTFIDYNENIKESVDENSAIAYLLRYMYSRPKKSRVVPSDAFTSD